MTERVHSVDVIIPTYNAGHQIHELLDGLSAQDYNGAISVIIVDSGSTDQTIEITKNFMKLPVKLIQIDNKDFTHSYARNLGADKSQAEVLLFMTQDASPEDNKWLSKMVKPLGEGYAAVSCAEDTSECPDLFYKISSKAYQRDLGILNQDRDGFYYDGMPVNELRKNSSLNNIACCINKDTFLKYKFCGNYAEDLDLGKRIITDGHKIKLLGTVHVKHYHVRSLYYHLKRQYVENKAVSMVLDTHEECISKEQAAWDICQLFICAITAISIIQKSKTHHGQYIRSVLSRQLMKALISRKLKREYVDELITDNLSQHGFDNDVYGIVKNAIENYGNNPYKNNSARRIRGFFKYSFEPYIKASKAYVTQDELWQITMKEAARLTGDCLAKVIFGCFTNDNLSMGI